MGIQINGSTDRITAIDGTIDFVSNIGNIGLITASRYELLDSITIGAGSTVIKTSNGRLGIGTNNPGYPLDIWNAGTQIRIQDSDPYTANAHTLFNQSGGQLTMINRNGAGYGTFIINQQNNSGQVERFRISNTGKVGINEADPDEFLHVNGVGAAIKVDSNGDSAVRWATSGTNKYSLYHNNSSNALIFYDNSNSAERLRITSTGKFGFGGVTPGGTPASKNVFLAIGDSDTGIVQDGDGQLELWANAVEVANINAIDGYTSTKLITTSDNMTMGRRLIHYGDADTYMEYTDNQIDFVTGGSSRMYATNSAVYVRSGLPLAFLASSGATPNIKSGGTNNQDLLFTTGSGNPTRLQITSDGKVGINEASNINGRLHVQHDAANENILYATRYNDQGNDKPILAITEATMTGWSASGLIIGNHNRDIHIGQVFDSSAAVTTGSTAGIRITNDGLIGVNRSPVYSGLFGGSQKGIHIGGTTAPFLRITSDTGGQGDLVLQAGNSGSDVQMGNLTGGGDITCWTKPSGGSASESMRIHDTGAVTKPRNFTFIVESNGTSITTGWNKLTGLSLDTGQSNWVNTNYWDGSNQRFTPPVTGTYSFFFGGWGNMVDSSGANRYATCFRINGGSFTYIAGGNYCAVDSPLCANSICLRVTSSQYIELYYYSSMSGTWGGSHRIYWGASLLG